MHPIERLRFVARSHGAPAALLVEESARALVSFRDDHAGLVAACRRIVDRQLTCAPLWWLCARILCAADPAAEAFDVVEEIAADPTARHLDADLPADATAVVVGWPEQSVAALRRRGDVAVVVVDVDGDAHQLADDLERRGNRVEVAPVTGTAVAVADAAVVLVEGLAVGPAAALVPAGSAAAAAVAARHGVPVWLVAGTGRMLPGSMFDALVDRWSAGVDPLDADEELLPLEWCDRVAGVRGVLDVPAALAATDCPVVPELFRLAG